MSLKALEDILLSFLIALVLGWSPVLFAKILLIVWLNALSIPLILAFKPNFPPWVWYVIALSWLTDWIIIYERRKEDE